MASRKERERLEEKDWNKIDETVYKSGSFLMRYRNQILIGVGVIVLIIGAYWAYHSLYLEPRNKDAQVAMYKGEQYFQAGMDSLAIYGDGNSFMGFESIIDEYGSTKAGDLAKAYAGISYARMGRYEQALDRLNSFKGGDNMITPAVHGAIGDCLVNTGKAQEAISHFEKAAKQADDQLLSPIYYKKAAIVYNDLKNYDKVIELFTKIKNDYIMSPEAGDADKFIQQATILKGAQ
ncbi:MAG TPA: hypothetical protein DIT04_09325 [Dysgonomonas sp.]|nr:hypothetical protein [Dysgonomonas sp.]